MALGHVRAVVRPLTNHDTPGVALPRCLARMGARTDRHGRSDVAPREAQEEARHLQAPVPKGSRSFPWHGRVRALFPLPQGIRFVFIQTPLQLLLQTRILAAGRDSQSRHS